MRGFRLNRIAFLFSFLCLLNACGIQSPRDSMPMGVLPKAMLKSLVNGTLSSVLEVYSSDATKVYQENLTVDIESGEVFSSPFNLEPNTTYNFLITFYFKVEGVSELPIAFVAKIITTQSKGNLEVVWDESEIVFLNEQVDSNLAAAFAVSLPPLDQDNDSESNFFEFQNGTNPADAKSFSSHFYVEENASHVHRCLQGGSVNLQWDINNFADVEKVTLIQSGSGQALPLSVDVTNVLDDTGHGIATLSCDSEKTDFELQVSRSGKPVDSKKIKIAPVILSNANSGDAILPDHQFVFDDRGLDETLSWYFKFHEIDLGENVEKEAMGKVVQVFNLKPRRDYLLTLTLKDGKNQPISEKEMTLTTRDKRLAAWWRFDEGMGDAVRDYSGQDHLINLFGQYQWVNDEVFGSGVNFGGEDYAVLEAGVHASPDALAVEVLFDQGNEVENTLAILAQNGEYGLQISKGFYVVGMMDGGNCGQKGFLDLNSTKIYNSSISAVTGMHYVVFIYDKNDPDGLRIFVDGQEDPAVSDNGVPVIPPLNNNCNFPFTVNYISANSQFDVLGNFFGSVHEIAVYKDVISAQEVLQNCAKIAPGLCPLP